MKHCAISITAKEQAELVVVAVPGAVGANEVRGQTVCTLISPGTELAWNYTGMTFPSFPGYAAIFAATDIGAEVKGVSEGDLLFCMGGHRSFQQVDARAARQVPRELPHHAVDFSPHSIHTGFDTAISWLADGCIRTDGLITRADPRDAQRAYQDLLHRRAQGLFTIFDWSRTASEREKNG